MAFLDSWQQLFLHKGCFGWVDITVIKYKYHVYMSINLTIATTLTNYNQACVDVY